MAIGYAFITGLAFSVVKNVVKDLKVVDIQEPPPPPETPPPPPPPETPQAAPPPPIVAPPAIVQTPTLAPPVYTVPVAPPPAPVITPTAPPAPPAPVVSQAAAAKGDPRTWITNDDYPPGAMREERSGVSGIAWTINEQGRVENCHVTSSSGSSDLDDTACRLVTRRGRYAPAKDQAGNPIKQTASIRFRWVLPSN
ncbi:TonB family protein [Sphingomonas sp.]|uniref:TonB family protein n=1 Tax=Sphingomonas sp. TaxID=28214 RepID=UPI003B3B0530